MITLHKGFSQIVYYLFLALFSVSFVEGVDLEEKPMVVIIPSYNNTHWYKKNLDSVMSQKYRNYRLIYLDDCSEDSTATLVSRYLSKFSKDYQEIFFDSSGCSSIEETLEKFCREINSNQSKITFVRNVQRCGALENLTRAIYSCDDDEIIVTVDGDDWLATWNVLSQLNEVYTNGIEDNSEHIDVWLTHGRLREYPNGHAIWCEPIPKNIVETNSFRKFKCPSHLRTFYSWLYKKIKLEDLLHEGKFFAMTWDMAMMYPMIEMAGNRHAFIEDVNYIYNVKNSINDNKVNPDLQNALDVLIRKKTPYKKLD